MSKMKYDTLSQTVNSLKKRGYDENFVLHDNAIECPEVGETFRPEAFEVDEHHRFEGMTNPADSSVVYAISTESGVKGILVDGYGAYSSPLKEEMIQKLKVR